MKDRWEEGKGDEAQYPRSVELTTAAGGVVSSPYVSTVLCE